MDWLKILLIGAVGAVVTIAIWFVRLPGVRQAQAASDGEPNIGLVGFAQYCGRRSLPTWQTSNPSLTSLRISCSPPITGYSNIPW